MSVEFQDFSIEVIGELDEKALQLLYDAAGELVAQTKRNVPSKGRWFTEQKNAWRYEVDEDNFVATIGNPQERSLWTEFGTGSYAEGGKGRKGYWVYVKGSDSADSPPKGGKSYTLEEAKHIMAMLRADGLDAHITNGQSPKRPFRTAYNTARPKIERRAAQLMNSRLK